VFNKKTHKETVGIWLHQIPQKINHYPNKPSVFILPQKSNSMQKNEAFVKCPCVGCLKPQCIKFEQKELTIHDDRLSEFPMDADDSVCPSDAITWEYGHNIPSIIIERCINCGICARRCPVGAIYSNGKNAVIHYCEKNVKFFPVTDAITRQHETQLSTFKKCIHEGMFIVPDEKSIATLYNKLDEHQVKPRFPNLIVRNLFLVLGNQCIMRRRGDIYFRIDAVLSDKPIIGVAEVEFNKDSLESPRAILDDIAVLVSRYEIEKVEIKPFIISLEFPNLRTEYWRVIKDIKDVLGIQINSLSLGALCILAWMFIFAPINEVEFYADVDSPSIKLAVEKACNYFCLSGLTNYAVLEPKK